MNLNNISIESIDFLVAHDDLMGFYSFVSDSTECFLDTDYIKITVYNLQYIEAVKYINDLQEGFKNGLHKKN